MKRVEGAVAAASVLLVVLTIWMVVRVRDAAPVVQGAAQALLTLPSRSPAEPVPAVLRRIAATPLSSVAHSRVEVCGLGLFALPVPEREAEAAIDAAVIGPLALQARERLVATLDASADMHERALGHYLARADGEPSRREALATLALHTSDARVYRLAIAACERRTAEPSQCERLSSEQWARLDPDNAVPWLQMAAEASGRSDGAAVAEALFRAARSRVLESDWHGAARLLQRPDVTAMPPAQRLGLWADLFSRWGAMLMPSFHVTTQYCQQAGADPNRQQSCGELAMLLAERGDNLFAFGIGVKLAEHAGWSDDRRQRLADESDALLWAAGQPHGGDAPTYSCEWWRGHERFFAELAAKNELGALRERIVASGRGIAELADAKRAALAEARSTTAAARPR